MEKAVQLVQKVFIHALTVPALNKWTTVAPCLCVVAAMGHFCNVVPEAFGRCFPPKPVLSETEDDSGRELGAPVDQTKVWRKLARKRQAKAAHFLRDAEARWATLLWATAQEPVMPIHYLFKRGTWVAERGRDNLDAQEAGATHFADPRRSPAVTACASLALLLESSEEAVEWKGIVGLYGPLHTWPQHRLRAARRCLLVGIGQLFRKLMEPMAIDESCCRGASQ